MPSFYMPCAGTMLPFSGRGMHGVGFGSLPHARDVDARFFWASCWVPDRHSHPEVQILLRMFEYRPLVVRLIGVATRSNPDSVLHGRKEARPGIGISKIQLKSQHVRPPTERLSHVNLNLGQPWIR